VSVPVTFRPRRLRRMCWVLAVAIVIVCTSVSFGLHGSLGDGSPGVFQRGDQLAMIGLGVVAAIGVLMFARPRVVADQRMVHIRNVIGGYDLPWEVVRAVRFSRGSAWASLELEDDDLVGVLAIQANDKEYAIGAVRALRALLEENRAAHAAQSQPGAADS
jgi:Bacterial PH domain